jgi:hypothetical protein
MNDHLALLAAQLAEKHRIPETSIVHPELANDPMLPQKQADPNYVPYCLKTADCGRVRRRRYGFECPTCGNKMNYDLTHYDGNKSVEYAGEPAKPEDALAGFPPVPGERWWPERVASARLAQRRAKHAERTAWNDAVDAKKRAKKGRK